MTIRLSATNVGTAVIRQAREYSQSRSTASLKEPLVRTSSARRPSRPTDAANSAKTEILPMLRP